MRFILDLHLSPRLCRFVRQTGHGCDTAWGLRLRSDEQIWAAARADNAVVVSKDWDFFELHRSVGGARLLWLRTGNESTAALIGRLRPVWPLILRTLESGQTLVELA